jgi:hypothetical protein
MLAQGEVFGAVAGCKVSFEAGWGSNHLMHYVIHYYTKVLHLAITN